MKCNHCEKEIGYGYKHCTECGNLVDEAVLESAYKETVWGRIDVLIDKYKQTPIKKLTDNFFFRIIVMLFSVFLIYIGFTTDDYHLRIVENGIYRIQYDTKTDEYYVLSDEENFVLGVHIPKFCDKVRFICYKEDNEVQNKVMKREDCEIEVVKGKYDYMIIEALRGDKISQSLKFSCI